MKDPVDLLIVDPHAIHRCGVVTCLGGLDEIGVISEVASTDEARAHPALRTVGLVIVDDEAPGADEFVREICLTSAARVVICTSRSDGGNLLGAIHAGAVGLVTKQSLTREGLVAALRVAVNGASVVTPELLATLLAVRLPVESNGHRPGQPAVPDLTHREAQVLGLIADGHRTREVAEQLSYSERTVKNILHDILVKLNVRSRSQAVARAVREGLI